MQAQHHQEDCEPAPHHDGPSTPEARSPRLSFVLPPAEMAYLERVVTTLQGQLQHHLVGVYLFGSAAYGEYEQGISDLDVQAVITESLGVSACQEIAARLQHMNLPCPARRLEFVLYQHRAIHPASRHPHFEMNYNTGQGEADHLTLDPTQEASHWFLLDIAMGRERGRSLVGPPSADVFAPIPRLWQLEAIADSLAWHHDHELTSANSVLNACRGWRYAVTGVHGSKRTGALWARQQAGCPAVVAEAAHRRHGGPLLNAGAVMELNAIVIEAVQTAIRQEQRSA